MMRALNEKLKINKMVAYMAWCIVTSLGKTGHKAVIFDYQIKKLATGNTSHV